MPHHVDRSQGALYFLHLKKASQWCKSLEQARAYDHVTKYRALAPVERGRSKSKVKLVRSERSQDRTSSNTHTRGHKKRNERGWWSRKRFRLTTVSPIGLRVRIGHIIADRSSGHRRDSGPPFRLRKRLEIPPLSPICYWVPSKQQSLTRSHQILVSLFAFHRRDTMKVVDKMNAATKSGETFYSFEFFPPRTDEVCWKRPGGLRARRSASITQLQCWPFRALRTCSTGWIVWQHTIQLSAISLGARAAPLLT